MESEYVYGMTVTWQNCCTLKEMCSSVTVSTTNPTWTGALGEKLGLDGENVLCYIIPYVNTEFFLHPLRNHNGF